MIDSYSIVSSSKIDFYRSVVTMTMLLMIRTTGVRGLASTTKSTTTATTTKTTNNVARSFVKNVNVPGLKNGMDYIKLGDSDLVVSKVCMGTMTFGKQNTETEGVEQLKIAYNDYGINFIDTAEMYPVPVEATTTGTTEIAVGKFIKTMNRDDIVLATKVAGRSERINWLHRREPQTGAELSPEQIYDAVDASLNRLQTDYIDLYQIHWPDRYTGGQFGSPDFLPSLYEEAVPSIPFEEQLSALQELVQQGKIKYVGVSNETPYGVSQMVHLAQQYPDLYPKIVSIQNSYSLVVRKDYEAGLSETCYHGKVGLLAYSPLASGTLSGKYRGEPPKGSRLTMFPGFMERYRQSLNEEAIEAYCTIASKHGLTPTQFALSWCYHNELVSSTIIGATTLEQLEENLKSYDIRLNDIDPSITEEILEVYKKYTDPTKARNNPQ